MKNDQKEKPKVMSEAEVLQMQPNASLGFDELKNDDVIEHFKERSRQASDYFKPQHDNMKESLKLDSDNCWNESAFMERINVGRPAMVVNLLSSILKNVLAEHLMDNFQVDVVPRDEAGADFSTAAGQKESRVFTGTGGEQFNNAQFYTGLVNGIFSRGDVAQEFNTCMRRTLLMGFGGVMRMYTDYLDPMNNALDLCFQAVEDPFSFLIDPESQRPDFSDMNWACDTRVMTKKQAQRKYGKSQAFEEHNSYYDSASGREPSNMLVHGDNKMAKIVEYFDRRKVRMQFAKLQYQDGRTGFIKLKDLKNVYDEIIMNGGQVIDEVHNDFYQITKYILSGERVIGKGKIMHGFDEIPFIPMVGDSYFDEKCRMRYRGLLDPAADLQHMHNYNCSALAEIIAKSSKTAYQFSGDKNAFKRISNAIQDNETIVHVGPGNAINPIATPSADANLYNFIQMTPQMIKEVLGVSAAALGQRTNETSQKGIQARKAESDVGLRVYAYQAKLMIRRMARMIIKSLPVVYGGTRKVIIIDKDGERTPIIINTRRQIQDQQTGSVFTEYGNDVSQPANIDFVVKPVVKDTDSRMDQFNQNAIELGKTLGENARVVGPLLLSHQMENIGGPGVGKIIRQVKDAILPDDALTVEEIQKRYQDKGMKQQAAMQAKQQAGYQDPPPPPEIQKAMYDAQKAQAQLELAKMALPMKQQQTQQEMEYKTLEINQKQMEIEGMKAATSGKEADTRNKMAKAVADREQAQANLELSEAKIREIKAKAESNIENVTRKITSDVMEQVADILEDTRVQHAIKNAIEDTERNVV